MEKEKVQNELLKILEDLPQLYSHPAALKLQTLFGSYRRIVESLPAEHPYGRVKVDWGSEFTDIEHDIDLALKGKPAKESENRFREAREHIVDDIKDLLNLVEMA